MAISAADRARQSDRISQVREEAEEKEARLLKRKNEQLKRAEKRHNQEIQKLNEAYRNQLGQVREDQKETLTERQKDHQENISSLRKTYMGDIQKKMETQETDKRILKETYETELNKQKNVSVVQKENLLENHDRELSKRDEALTEATIHAREKMKEAMAHNASRLKEAHEKEKNVMKDYQDFNRIQNEVDKNQMRKAYENQKQQIIAQQRYENAAWEMKYKDLSDQVNGNNETGQLSQSELLKQGLQDVRAKYNKKLVEKEEREEKSNQAFRESIADRVDAQVRSKNNKIQNLSNKLNNEVVSNKRLRSLERNNLQSAYEDKLHDVERQRDETKEVMQDLNIKRVDDMKDRNESVLRQAGKNYRSQMDIERARFRENSSTMEQLKENEVNRISSRAEGRINKMQKLTELNTKQMADYYGDNLIMAKDNFDKKIAEQRERNIELQGQSNRIMSDRFRKVEDSYAKKLETTIDNYEAKMQEMKDKHAREIRTLQATSRSRLEDRDKGFRTEKESTEIKYETRIAMMEQEQRNRLDKLQKRHQEELRDLTLKLNQYNRKA